LVLVSCASNAGAASTSELLMASRVSLVFMCFLYIRQAWIWLPDRLTVIQEAARALWGVTLPEVFNLNVPCAPRLLSGGGSDGQQ
jgi:hypothetical protein